MYYLFYCIFYWDLKLQDILTFLEDYRHLFIFHIQSRIHTQNQILKFYAASLSWEFNTDTLVKRIFVNEIHMAFICLPSTYKDVFGRNVVLSFALLVGN